ncbi:hypothetical protein GGR58DRAFT_90718 [Xylaria digitata]|nr:hypothetical protein GGR58DRAFT_90718 [Xylaria digitata]
MASNRPPARAPSRLKTPTGYIATPVHTVAHTDTSNHLVNDQQRSSSVKVHPVARERFVNFSQLVPPSPTASSVQVSSKSKRSTLGAARKGLSLGLELGKATLEKTKPAVETAVTASKKVAMVAMVAAGHLSALRDNENEKGKEKNTRKRKKGRSRSSSSSSSSSTKSLFHRRRLPKLQIPELSIAVEEALHSACSTDTQNSPSFGILELSPTSRDLKSEMMNDYSSDVVAEFHNMFSARRRVRKGKFGAEVTRYLRARPTWDDHWDLRIRNDNREDRELLKRLTDALQKQKDYATRFVQKNPGSYPGLEFVSAPGCTLKIYWQHKSSYR